MTIETSGKDAAERAAEGKAARASGRAPAHAELSAASRDPLAILGAQDESRVPELVPIRYGRMLASPFAFFRGAAAVMAADLAGTPATEFTVQLCGDAHLSNFGVFAAPDRRLVFDCNDFDETCPGPFEWDVKRLVASVAVAGRQNGFGKRERRRASLATAAGYRQAMREYAAMRNLEVWYSRIDVEPALEALRAQVDDRRARRLQRNLAKAQAKDSIRALGKLTYEDGGRLRIVSEPPLITPLEDLSGADDAETAAADGRRHLPRVARVPTAATSSPPTTTSTPPAKWSGWAASAPAPGSSSCSAATARTRSSCRRRKRARRCSSPTLGASAYDHHGRRVVEGQRLMQAASDIFLGWVTVTGPTARSAASTCARCGTARARPKSRGLSAPELAVYGATLRPGAGPRPRPLRRPDRDRRLPRQRRSLRQGAGRVRRGLRGPQRSRLRAAARGRRQRPDRGRGGLPVSLTTIRRGILVLLLDAGILLLLSEVLDGFVLDGAATALGAAAMIGLLNAFVWPLLARLTLPLTVMTLGIAALVLNGIVVTFAVDLLPRAEVATVLDGIVITLVVAALTAAVYSLLAIDEDDSWYRNVVRRQARRRGQVTESDVPGVLFLEIDGLAHDVLLRALQDGNAPTLAAWVRGGSHRLRCWETDWSSQTGACQAGLLHGSNEDMPAFRWWEKERGEAIVTNHPRDAEEIERRHSDGRGLLHADGASRANILSGDAPHSMLTMSTALRRRPADRQGLRRLLRPPLRGGADLRPRRLPTSPASGGRRAARSATTSARGCTAAGATSSPAPGGRWSSATSRSRP